MSTVYLKDGAKATLVSKIEDGFVIRRHMLCRPCSESDEYQEEYEEVCDAVEIVKEVFSAAPVWIIEGQCKTAQIKVEIQEKILAERIQQLKETERELIKLKMQKTDISRYIINREQLRTAKRLILFVNGHVMSRVLDGSKSHRFTVSYEITQYREQEKCWAYKLWSENKDSGWSTSEYFDEQFGIKTDLTDEEIKTAAFERLSKKKFSDIHESILLQTPDEWLTPEWIQEKMQRKDRKEKQDLQSAEKALAEAQARVDRLLNKGLTVS